MSGNTLSGFKLLTTHNFVAGGNPKKEEEINIFRNSADQQLNNNHNWINSNNNLKQEGWDGLKNDNDSQYIFMKKKNHIDGGSYTMEGHSLDILKENFRILNYKQPRNIELIRSFFILKGVEKTEERDLTGNSSSTTTYYIHIVKF